jgi:hypothetical protein
VTEIPEPAVTEPDLRDDLRPLLDREPSRLPDVYRAAIVLCDLGGGPATKPPGGSACPTAHSCPAWRGAG